QLNVMLDFNWKSSDHTESPSSLFVGVIRQTTFPPPIVPFAMRFINEQVRNYLLTSKPLFGSIHLNSDKLSCIKSSTSLQLFSKIQN
ncbi:MAG: hypothetical protein ACXWMS_11625, partial [Syntrophales bacterium]